MIKMKKQSSTSWYCCCGCFGVTNSVFRRRVSWFVNGRLYRASHTRWVGTRRERIRTPHSIFQCVVMQKTPNSSKGVTWKHAESGGCHIPENTKNTYIHTYTYTHTCIPVSSKFRCVPSADYIVTVIVLTVTYHHNHHDHNHHNSSSS